MNFFRPLKPLTVLALASTLSLAGCAGGQQSGPTPAVSQSDEQVGQSPSATQSENASPSASDSPELADSSPVETQQPQGFDAFAFEGATLNGSSFDVEALRGQPTVFWFWTPWCTVCRADAPGIASLEAELGDRINFVGVAAQGRANEMVTFAAETGVTGFPHLADLDSSIWAHFGVPYQPAYVFVTASGESTLSVGSRSVSELELELLELIG